MIKKSLNKKQKGQGLVEYALIMVLVAVVVIAVLMILGPIIGNVFSKVNSSLSTVSTGGGAAAAPSAINCSSATAKWNSTVGTTQAAMAAEGWPQSGTTYDNWVAATNEWQNSPERTYFQSNGCH